MAKRASAILRVMDPPSFFLWDAPSRLYTACEAICATLADAGKELAAMAPDESLWKAAAQPEGVTSGTFYSRFHRYLAAAGLAPTGIHVLRHTAAKLRREPEILDELLARARPVVAGREWRGRGNPLRGHDPSLGVRRARKPAKPDQRPDV